MNHILFDLRNFRVGMTSVSQALRSALDVLASEPREARQAVARVHDNLSAHGAAVAVGGRALGVDVADLVGERKRSGPGLRHDRQPRRVAVRELLTPVRLISLLQTRPAGRESGRINHGREHRENTNDFNNNGEIWNLEGACKLLGVGRNSIYYLIERSGSRAASAGRATAPAEQVDAVARRRAAELEVTRVESWRYPTP